jgi:8-oxo-dGTP diphosphatase
VSYPPFAVTVDIVWLTIRSARLSVLLVERAGPPHAGAWALPGGFVEIDEDLPTAAARELAEETGLHVLPDGVHLEQLATYGHPGRDPRMRVVSVAYLAFSPDVADPVAGSDARNARWWPVEELTSGTVEVAFDHRVILDDAVSRARSKLEYTTLATSFVGDEFTLSELRAVYEAVWAVTLDPSNFRRKVLENPGVVVELSGRTPSDAGRGRPAQLYSRGTATLLTRPIERPE